MSGSGALMAAIENGPGTDGIVELLLRHGADPNEKGPRDATPPDTKVPLTRAREIGDSKSEKLLIQFSAKRYREQG